MCIRDRNREANTGVKYNPQKDMLPLIGEGENKDVFNSIIAETINADKESIISSDLFLYNREKGTVWGANNEFISAPRLDDVMCAYSCMGALINRSDVNEESVAVCAIFDNEEVGSTTKQGADSTFLSDVLTRIALCVGKDEEDLMLSLIHISNKWYEYYTTKWTVADKSVVQIVNDMGDLVDIPVSYTHLDVYKRQP